MDDLPRIGMFLDLEGGATHWDAGCFGLVAAGNDATIVVGEYNDLLPVEPWIKYPLTGDKEVIAVNQAVHDSA